MASISLSSQSLIVCVNPVSSGPDIVMHNRDRPTSRGVHSNPPDAAAPHSTPQIKGIHVTGFVSCSLIFQMSVSRSPSAPFIPSSCASPLIPPTTSCCFLPAVVVCFAAATGAILERAAPRIPNLPRGTEGMTEIFVAWASIV